MTTTPRPTPVSKELMKDAEGDDPRVRVVRGSIRLVEATAKTWNTFPASIDASAVEMTITLVGHQAQQ